MKTRKIIQRINQSNNFNPMNIYSISTKHHINWTAIFSVASSVTHRHFCGHSLEQIWTDVVNQLIITSFPNTNSVKWTQNLYLIPITWSINLWSRLCKRQTKLMRILKTINEDTIDYQSTKVCESIFLSLFYSAYTNENNYFLITQ